MSSDNPRRDNHYTPEAHLRRFADVSDPLGRVWVYDRTKPYKDQPKRRYPSQVGKEYDLYVRHLSPSEVDDALERWLGDDVDGPAAGAVAKLIASGPTSLLGFERRAMARYVAAQDIRTPASRAWMRDVLKRANPSLSENAFREAWLAYLRASPDHLAEKLQRSGWRVIHSPLDTSFLTSDIGLAKVLKDLQSHVPFAPGWSGLDTGYRHWVFPLDPRSVLYISPGITDGTIDNAKRHACRALNQRIIEQSLRYVFASSHDRTVHAVVTSTEQRGWNF